MQIDAEFGTCSWSDWALDQFISPGLSALTSANPPPIEEMPFFTGMLFLNNVLVAKVHDHNRFALLNAFVSNLGSAIREYICARGFLLDYIEHVPRQQGLDKHRRALSHFQTCLLRTHISITYLSMFFVLAEQGAIYEQKDGGGADRLRLINNRIKHFDGDVKNAVYSKKSKKSVPLTPIWLTNNGISAETAIISYNELANILNECQSHARTLCSDVFIQIVNREEGVETTDGSSETSGNRPD